MVHVYPCLSVAQVLLGAPVGDWVDRNERLYVVQRSLLIANGSVVCAVIVIGVLLSHPGGASRLPWCCNWLVKHEWCNGVAGMYLGPIFVGPLLSCRCLRAYLPSISCSAPPPPFDADS